MVCPLGEQGDDERLKLVHQFEAKDFETAMYYAEGFKAGEENAW